MQHFESLSCSPLSLEQFCTLIRKYFPEYQELSDECFVEILIGLNAPITRKTINKNSTPIDYIELNSKNIALRDCKLCFVDIETTSGNIEYGQIIEIGAIITENNNVCDVFDTFIYSAFVPEEIVKLTGIHARMLENAPKIDKVLKDFRDFLGDCVFVAHNVSFDYNFLSENMLAHNIAPLFNTRLCTVELSRRIIPSKKHALSYLDIALGINTGISHRALADAFTSMCLYNICMLSLPSNVISVQDLIDFSKGRIDYPTRATSKRSLTKSTTKHLLN